MIEDNFSSSEKQEARKNGFILLGKTGVGKSTLLNVIIDKEIAETKNSSSLNTKNTSVYYHKLKNGKMVAILDTPGLSDLPPDIKNLYLKEIIQTIQDENIEIKGIFFLVDYISERFAHEDQKALITYNNILFPLENFWKYLVLIFTHYYCDPYEDEDEHKQMEKERDNRNKEVLLNIMKTKAEVSNISYYNECIMKYFNSYSPAKNIRQKERNKKNKKELEEIIHDLSKREPLYLKYNLLTNNFYTYKENNSYFKATLNIISYYGLEMRPIKEIKLIIDKKEITRDEYSRLNNNISNILNEKKTSLEGKDYRSGKHCIIY